MKKIELTFDTIARVITSLGAIVFVMLMTVSGMIFFSHTLFIGVFPAGMNVWEHRAATWLMAIGWESTVLITTVNVKHVNKHVPLVMALCSGIIVLFFIQAFDGTQTWLTITERWFVGTLAATINYIYADLFYAKWVERLETIAQPTKVNDLQATVHERDATINELRAKLVQVQPQLMELHDLRTYKKQNEASLICQHCKEPQSNAGTLRSHKGHCVKNPINIKKTEL